MYLRSFAFICSMLLFLLCVINIAIYGQSGSTTGAIKGVVLDEQKAVITGAIIIAKHLSTNTIKEAKSDKNGNYNLLQLPSGTYELRVAADGFLVNFEIIDVTLEATIKTEHTLTIMGITDYVVVKGNRAYFEDRIESTKTTNELEKISLSENLAKFIVSGKFPNDITYYPSNYLSGGRKEIKIFIGLNIDQEGKVKKTFFLKGDQKLAQVFESHIKHWIFQKNTERFLGYIAVKYIISGDSERSFDTFDSNKGRGGNKITIELIKD